MNNKKVKKYKYTGYCWALSIIGLFSFLTTGFYINALVINSNSQNWLSVLVGILWGLCFSILTAFLIKCSDDKRYDNAQKSFVINLHDYYLKDFRQALKNYAMYYVNAFKPRNEYLLFRDIQSGNRIDVDALIYNFAALQHIKDNVPKAKGWPSSQAEWIVEKLKDLCMVTHTHYYLHYYYELCEESNKVVSIAKIENEKYDYPIFSEDELMYLERYEDAVYYYNMSNDLQEKNPQKFDDFNFQHMFQWFRHINDQLALFNIDLVPMQFSHPTQEERKILDGDRNHFRAVAKSGEEAAESIIEEYKTHNLG